MRLGKQRNESKYLAIEDFNTNKGWSISWMCHQLGITRSAFYKWKHRIVPEQEQLNSEIAELIKEYDERFSHILGYRRMTDWINHFNHTIYSRKRIHRIMKILDIHALIRKKRKKYKTTKPEETAENKLARNFYTTAPNKKWVTDVTEFKIPNSHKKLYLSAILDLYDRYPIAFVISGRNDNRLVFKTFDKAIEKNPTAKPIFHSDRGFQYTNKNGPIEGFWGIIKSEMYQMYDISDETSLRYAIKDYIRFYSHERPQSRYDCKTPWKVRNAALTSKHPLSYPIAKNNKIEQYKSKWSA